MQSLKKVIVCVTYTLNIITIAVLFSGCGDDGPVGILPLTVVDGILVYEYEDELETYVKINRNGNITPLNNPHGQKEWQPAVSPDGTKVAFIAQSGPIMTLHVKTLEGDALRALPTGWARYPSWSPDGSQLVYQGIVSTSERGLYVINVDGTERNRISQNFGFPSWSSDSTLIYYGFEDKIYSVTPSGSAEMAIKAYGNMYNVLQIAISPIGGHLALQLQSHDYTTSEIHIVGVDGLFDYRLSGVGIWALAPCWSPDGKKVAYSYGFTIQEIGATTITNGLFERLTNSASGTQCHQPSWGLVPTI